MYATADMLISDILRARPESAEVFSRHGLGCPSCLAAGIETVSAVASMHDVDVDLLLTEINQLPEDGSVSMGGE